MAAAANARSKTKRSSQTAMKVRATPDFGNINKSRQVDISGTLLFPCKCFSDDGVLSFLHVVRFELERLVEFCLDVLDVFCGLAIVIFEDIFSLQNFPVELAMSHDLVMDKPSSSVDNENSC